MWQYTYYKVNASGSSIVAVHLLWEQAVRVRFSAPRLVELAYYIWYDRTMPYRNPLKIKALSLRKQGYSYSLIRDKLGISKSTLSNWLTELPFTPNKQVLKRIGNASLRMVQRKQAEKFSTWERIKDEAEKEIGPLTERDLFMFGLGLYLGEGTKSYGLIRVINADPDVIKLAIKWFTQTCDVPLQNFRLTIHLYPDSDIAKILAFWHKQTGIPIKNFGKTQIDRRLNKSKTKHGKLPYGTAQLSVVSNGNAALGVQLHRRILAWMDFAIERKHMQP